MERIKKSLRTGRLHTSDRPDSSGGDHGRSLPYLRSVSWSKMKSGRVLSRHAVRGKSARELLWTSLSVLGRSTAADGVTGRTSESASEVNGISGRCSRMIPCLKITGGAHMWRPETEDEREQSRRRAHVLNLRPKKERSHNSSIQTAARALHLHRAGGR